MPPQAQGLQKIFNGKTFLPWYLYVGIFVSATLVYFAPEGFGFVLLSWSNEFSGLGFAIGTGAIFGLALFYYIGIETNLINTKRIALATLLSIVGYFAASSSSAVSFFIPYLGGFLTCFIGTVILVNGVGLIIKLEPTAKKSLILKGSLSGGILVVILTMIYFSGGGSEVPTPPGFWTYAVAVAVLIWQFNFVLGVRKIIERKLFNVDSANDNKSKSNFLTWAGVVISIALILGSYYLTVAQIKKNSRAPDLNNLILTPTKIDNEYYEIKELGIKIKLPNELRDLTYYSENTWQVGKSANFSTTSIEKESDGFCAPVYANPLGKVIVVASDASGDWSGVPSAAIKTIGKTGIYYLPPAPQTRCNELAPSSVKLITVFQETLKTAHLLVIPPGEYVTDTTTDPRVSPDQTMYMYKGWIEGEEPNWIFAQALDFATSNYLGNRLKVNLEFIDTKNVNQCTVINNSGTKNTCPIPLWKFGDKVKIYGTVLRGDKPSNDVLTAYRVEIVTNAPSQW